MGIYIKGIKMPTGADELRLIILPNGQTIISKQTYYEETEAVELPPHGLIDKQMLLRNIADNQFAHSSVGHEEDYAFWGKVWDYINDAPTIIEAEGDE